MCSSVHSISCGSCSIQLQQFVLTATWTEGSTFAFPPIWVPVRSLNEFHLEGHLPVVFSLSWSTTSIVNSLIINLSALIVWGLNSECCGELLSVVMKILLTNYAEMSIHEEFFDWHKILERASWCCYFEASMTCCTLWFPVSGARGSGCHGCWIQT